MWKILTTGYVAAIHLFYHRSMPESVIKYSDDNSLYEGRMNVSMT
jgi:hypothetical protein